MRGRARIMLLGVAALVIGSGISAFARQGVQTRTATASVAEDEAGTAIAKCRGKTRPVSGGFKQDFEPDEVVVGTSPQLQQFNSHRAGGRRWKGSAYNLGDPGDLTTFAYCRSGGLERSTKRTTIAGTPFMQPNVIGKATAKCPRGATAVSGGFANPTFVTTGDYSTDTRILPFVSKRKGARGWTVVAQNSGGAQGTLVAHAYCHDGPAPGIRRKSSTFSPPVNNVEVGTVVAKCDRDQRVVAGGFQIGGTSDTPLMSRKAGSRKWKVSASVPFPGETRVTALAYCEAE